MSRTLALGMIGALTGIGLCAQNAKADVPMAVAVEAAQTAVAACKANGYNVAATIMDADLSTRVVLRGDGAPDGTVEFGRRKAYTVIKTGMSSGEFGKTAPAPASRRHRGRRSCRVQSPVIPISFPGLGASLLRRGARSSAR